ncbi:DUF1064 domain-containing protein [Acinetobacter bereziniae]|uniref:DUF1064 domain-containing protein n=1 Tax=Acinetobacter bereziniae TaxID=106648 RepID=UPI0019020D71|nr:DUF1064 domain-containing protein [Acinetobacter bereziniae]MBJ9903161.1 DUF1064 domain-containing protein [Acinetobacter bereziniae]WMW72959.1 DUF1064 domain-containing protein [Acinetobacter bereziniae]
MNLSPNQIKRLVHQRDNKPKQPKYGNQKVIIDGEKVADSKHEFRRLNDLIALQRVGQIKDLQTQVRYKLIPAQKICGVKVRGTDYVADFVYWTSEGQFICEDAKGHKTADYIIKRKLMKMIHDIDVVEV